ncbi:MAG: 16S rRNA (uracil(1498)-N(3))-methyltransferase [Tannerella sp.]|jgi:16S rRNA (uracil1498-N3)-methyltransferase|nr:16S rRNA (uracil(1498)-N(3))-methyltransferase [Tannerella sp.]
MQLFYAPDIMQSFILPEEESAHAIRVLRMKEEDKITLTDGKGFFYLSEIVSAHPKRVEVRILKQWTQERLRPFYLHLALSPTKHMVRMEWLIEKATEIGIDAVTFLQCRFSERRIIKTTARLEKIMISAMKQSQKASLPLLTGMTNFNDLIKQPFDGRKFMAHCETKDRLLLKQIYRPGEKVLILIGPEGDFSAEEIRLSLRHGFEPVSLGKSRLRTETAALAACHTIHVLNQ